MEVPCWVKDSNRLVHAFIKRCKRVFKWSNTCYLEIKLSLNTKWQCWAGCCRQQKESPLVWPVLWAAVRFVWETSTSDGQDILLSHSARNQTSFTSRSSPDSSQSFSHEHCLQWQSFVMRYSADHSRPCTSWSLFAFRCRWGLIAWKQLRDR